MSVLLTILFFLFLISFLVIIHEAGHFVAARLFGVTVYEFGLGYPPKARDLFKKWGTWFSLNWLPFGGFVRLAGEERESVNESKLSENQKEGLFYKKPAWQRLIIILAGAAVNFAFGVVAFSLLFTFLGIPETFGVVISEVSENSPAAEAGLVVEDTVEAVVMEGARVEIDNLDDFVDQVSARSGETVELEVVREGESLELPVYVRAEGEIPEGEGAIGVAISPESFEFVKYAWWQMPFRGAWFGTGEALRFGWEIVLALGNMVRDLFVSGSVPADVGGPVRIVYEAQKAELLREGPLAILNFAAVLSINLAIVNVLPIPALDGGRALFIMLEKLLGTRFKSQHEQVGNAMGMIALLTLIVLISFRDVGLIFADAGWGMGRIWEIIQP